MHVPPVRPTIRRAASAGAAVTAAAIAPVVAAPPAAAHQRWFIEESDGGNWGAFFSPAPLLATAAVVLVAVVWRAVALRLPTPELRFLRPLGRLAPYVPRLLGIHLGVALLALAVTGSFLSPALPLEDTFAPTVLGLLEAALGTWFITGVRLRPAALALAALGPVALAAAGPVAVLETTVLLGVALFLAVLPPSDATFGAVRPTEAQLRTALLLLRVGAAVTLVTLAFSEKFTNPVMAEATLHEYPQLNVLAQVGLPVSDAAFVSVAGATELLFGLLVLSGALPQVAVLVAAVPFNATLLIFGQTELVGHLPVYGVFLVLLVYGSHPATARAVRWLPSPRGAVAEARQAARPALAGLA